MFASKTVTEHLVRGAVGISALVFTPVLALRWWPAWFLLPLGLVALRGCPLCWTLGLAQTVWAKVRGRSIDDACVDGACALRGHDERPAAASAHQDDEIPQVISLAEKHRSP